MQQTGPGDFGNSESVHPEMRETLEFLFHKGELQLFHKES